MNQDVIDYLKPESQTHQRLLDFLLNRLRMSEDKMRGFYDRWTANERRMQAYITMRNYKDLLAQQKNDGGRSPVPVDIVVPYSYATANTINTYLLHTFMGREPIFQVQSNNSAMTQNAQSMETKLQYDCYHNRFVKIFWQFGMDQQIYGFGAMFVDWKVRQAMRSQQLSAQPGMFNQVLQASDVPQRTRQLVTVYEGNEISNIDPFCFFPDPRVPMSEVNREGEFVFKRTTMGRHKLKIGEARKEYVYTSAVGSLAKQTDTDSSQSDRALLAQGESNPARASFKNNISEDNVQLDEGTCFISPKEWGLGESDEPTLWFFTIGNRRQIIQAIPYDFDHGLHPIVVAEPDRLGHSFGSPSPLDFYGPIQDTASWFVNSHVRNTQKVIHNTLVVDPAMVEMQDLKLGGEARVIRLKQSAYGQDVRMALNQLQVTDVTRTHMQDLQGFIRLMDMITGVNDNQRGMQQGGGRKTATEVRTAGESGGSRLAGRSLLVSSMSMVDLAMMMSLNNMQFISQEFSFRALGSDGLRHPITLQPDQIVGDFHYPVNDGTLPLDKVALLDVWQQMFQVIISSPLSNAFNIPKLFLFIAQLGGAKNVEEFLLDPSLAETGIVPMADPQVQQQVQAGNLVPTSALPGGIGVPADPGSRMAGAL